MKAAPARSTLADALERRDWRIYHALAQRLIARARALYAQEPSVLELDASVYALDSTTIDLCLSLFDWAPFRSTKAAVKLHTLLDLRGAIPTFHPHQRRQAARCQRARHPADRGRCLLRDGSRLRGLRAAVRAASGRRLLRHSRQAKHGRPARVLVADRQRTTGVICDQTRRCSTASTRPRPIPEHLRRIRFKDPESGKTLVFLTNNTTLPALTIAALYKSRWQVELFFKWIKQHLRIKRFFGTSENAVKTQIWIAVSTYVLIAIVKKELHLDASLYTLLQILSVSVFEKTEISCALQPDRSQREVADPANQLILFDF